VPEGHEVGQAAGGIPDWLTVALGGDLADVRRLGWGFTNESWAATLPTGDRVVATRLADPGTGQEVARRWSALAGPLGHAGVPVPALLRPPCDAGPEVLVSRHVDGVPGSALVETPGGPELIGGLLGRAWRALGSVAVDGLGLEEPWAPPPLLVERLAGWVASLAPELGRSGTDRLGLAVKTGVDLLENRPVGLVHGDLVPANLIVRDASAVALLDFEATRLGDPWLDAAWFDWIVWFHHRSVEAAAWRAFTDAAGVTAEAAAMERRLRLLPLVRLLEILEATHHTPAARARWLIQLEACLGRAG
jgi:aminoglycoside phosphotransferase (APT) family kinase protein